MRWLPAMRFCPFLVVAILASLCSASVPRRTALHVHQAPVPVASLHHSQISDSAAGNCEFTQPPEALATPDPLLDPFSSDDKVAVSFVIGIDGRVHSPVILEGASSEEDDQILRVLRLWRYRPATCNAAPTEMESKVEFSRR